MKFSKVLLLLAAFTAFSFAEEAKTEETKSEETNSEGIKENIAKQFKEPKIKGGKRSKEECEQGFKLLQELYADIEKDPKCTYSQEYADEHKLTGDYTMDINNRDYFCTQCMNKYLKFGNSMALACDDNSPREMILDLYFLSSVHDIICARDKLHSEYCEVVIDELFKKENGKPIINWSEDSICGECPYYYHDIFKTRPDFYNSVKKDSKENSFVGRLLPLRNIEIDCFKKFDEAREKARKEAKEAKEGKKDKKVVNLNDILKEEQKKKDEEEKEEPKVEKEEEPKAEEKEEPKVEEEEPKAEEKEEPKVEEKPKKPSDEL